MLLWHTRQKPSPFENLLPSCHSHSKTNILTSGLQSCGVSHFRQLDCTFALGELVTLRNFKIVGARDKARKNDFFPRQAKPRCELKAVAHQ